MGTMVDSLRLEVLMHQSRVAVFAFLILLSSALPAGTQQAPSAREGRHVQVALTHSISMPGGGWDWAEAVRTTGIRLGAPLAGQTTAWISAARAEINDVACTALSEECAFGGNPYFFQAGIGYRFAPDRPGRIVPFAGAGASLERWSRGGQTWMPHLHGGVDWIVLPHVALRVEAQSEWQVPGRMAFGVTLLLP